MVNHALVNHRQIICLFLGKYERCIDSIIAIIEISFFCDLQYLRTSAMGYDSCSLLTILPCMEYCINNLITNYYLPGVKYVHTKQHFPKVCIGYNWLHFLLQQFFPWSSFDIKRAHMGVMEHSLKLDM